MESKSLARKNRVFFGLGTIGRDMFYSMISMYLMYYLTEILDLPDSTMWWMTGVMTVLRVFDALNDPIMGTVIDNVDTKYGKFKPPMLIGALVGGALVVLLFMDLGMTGAAYIVFFTVVYLLWDVFYGANDIAYWSMMPALTLDQKERERIGAFARICANIGMFAVVVGILPATGALTGLLGDAKQAWLVFAIIVTLLMLAFQLFTLLGVKERRERFKKEEKTTLREMVGVIFKNDQLLYTTVAMALFMIGYSTTTSFGTYYFKYAFGNEGMYSVFAAILGVSQLGALTVFPLLSKRLDRKKLYALSTALVIAGYILFFFAPMNMLVIGVAGVLIFVGQAFIQLLMLMFLADTIEYGQWKSGKRNESITFSVQPLINKIGGAVASGIVGVTLILSGINSAKTPADVTASGLMMMKIAMLALPLVCIVAGYIVYRRKYKIDSALYTRILGELKQRGDIKE